jgi:hypothetical protein
MRVLKVSPEHALYRWSEILSEMRTMPRNNGLNPNQKHFSLTDLGNVLVTGPDA